MEELFVRFLKKIGIEDISLFEGCSFKVNHNDKESGICYVTITSKHCFQYVAARTLLDKLDSAPFKTNVTFVYENQITSDEVYALLRDEFVYNTNLDFDRMPNCVKGKNEVKFTFYGKIHFETFVPVLEMWEELLDQLFIPFDIKTDISYVNDEIIKEREKQFDEALRKKIGENYSNRLETIYSDTSNHQRVRGNYVPIKIHEINESTGNVEINGEVFFIEERISRQGKMIVTLYVYDHTDSIEVVLFENRRNFSPEKIAQYKKKGAHLKIKGSVRVSKYSKELQVSADYISINEEPFNIERLDESEEKRVELHSHSKMSTMDGVCTIDDYFKQASKWGHKAFAITDHENVQIFPEVQEASKKYGIKGIYGVEMNMIDDALEYIYNPSERELHNATYVVFDFEKIGRAHV